MLRPIALGLCLALALAAPCVAQPIIEFKDDAIIIGGIRVPQEDLPKGLDLHADTWDLRFEIDGHRGDGRWLLTINGELFTVDKTIGRVTHVPMGLGGATNARNLAFIVKETSEQLQTLTLELPFEPPQEQVLRVLADARTQLEGAAVTLESLPHSAVMVYLQDMWEGDSLLFQLMVEEWQLELQAKRLSEQIRKMPEGREREEKLVELRNLLDEVFERKQQNRLSEVEALEEKLNLLQRSLNEREDIREALIRRRLEDLLRAGR